MGEPAQRRNLPVASMQSVSHKYDLSWDHTALEVFALGARHDTTATLIEDVTYGPDQRSLSSFEAIFTTFPPIIESFLAQIPTSAVLDLYHTSSHLRNFLHGYPLAWKALSFRLPQPAVAVGSPGNETPDGRDRQSKAYSFDALLKRVVAPCGTRLTNLDLCNTAVSGTALGLNVLGPRSGTLKHLSVRGCKNVSIKYHIVPWLEPFSLDFMPDSRKDLALTSLYTYRCRHHRRRPYLPSSLVRRDSDSDPTHQLIEICHKLDIYTDTAWCPTPGGRCYRRKDYHAGRAGPLNQEVWVPFDRLWRSSNRIGQVDGSGALGEHDGRLWEIAETGEEGEALGTESGNCKGEGKHVPAHLRKSHTIFVDDITCSQCNDIISERCESCSVRMHCMGCRKTLCASCAFNRPLPKKRVKTRSFTNLAFGLGSTVGNTLSHASGTSSSAQPHLRNAPSRRADPFWWAPGISRSPNLMHESANEEDSDTEDDALQNHHVAPPPVNREPPKLNMQWCCLEPIFSGGGGIAVLGTGLGGRGADKIRAAPLPRTKRFIDPEFSNALRSVEYMRELKNNGLYDYVLGDDVDLLSYLRQDSLDLQAQNCPRGLCNDCHRSFRWKISCRACKSPICKEHDFRALKFRKCGYRDMLTERHHVRSHTDPPRLTIPEFNPNKMRGKDPERTPTSEVAPTVREFEMIEHNAMSQSQILMAAAAPTSVEMTATPSFGSDASRADLLPFAGPVTFVPVSSNRPRSLSVSGVRTRNGATWINSPRPAVASIANTVPLPCNPRHPVQWEGCGAYFCQYPRPVGDTRAPCPAFLKECTECAVEVCDQCANANPSCTCTYCNANYHCPVCARKPDVKSRCRFETELKAKRDAERRAAEKLQRDIAERGQADEMAGCVFDFFSSLLPHESDISAHISHDSDVAETEGAAAADESEMPVPSPDSITVTTVFGFQEESGNFTTVTAVAAPASQAQAMAQSYHEDDATLSNPGAPGMSHQSGGPYMHQPSGSFTATTAAIDHLLDELALEMQHNDDAMSEDEADDGDIDTDVDQTEDSFDAESAVIDEFMDDGMLTPTMSITTDGV